MAAMAAGDMQELSRLLSLAHAPGPQMAQATEQLWLCESRTGFGIALLQLVQSDSVDCAIRQAAGIYLKNFAKRRWGVEQGGIPLAEREVIKEALIPVALRAPRPVRLQLLATLEEVSSTEFPAEWPQLLPDLARHLASAEDVETQTAALQAMHAVFRRFRSPARPSGDPVREARSCGEAVGPAHLQVWSVACKHVLSGVLAAAQLNLYWGLLGEAVAVLHDLHALALPTFFCESREPYLEGLIAILSFRGSGIFPSGGPGPLETLQGEVCHVLALYASRYEEQFGGHVGRTVKAVWDLLTAIGQREEFDQVAASGINFLTAAASTEWPNSPFDEPAALQAICEHIVLPNVQLRPSDILLFEESPSEYIVRDVEGGDEDTRRRCAMDLVRSLRRFHNVGVCEVLVAYAGQLLERAKAADDEQAMLWKDACIHLVIAMGGPSPAQGGLNAGIVEQFFSSQVVPELQSEPRRKRGLLRAACLKYVTVLRTVLPAPCVLGILPAVARHVLAEDPVIHSYAAVCVNVITTVQDSNEDGSKRPRFDPQVLRAVLAPVVLPILQILAEGRGIPQNEHLARALVAILVYLEAHASEVALPALHLVAQVISRVLVPNPANPECVHACFDACALLLKLLMPARSSEVEGLLRPVFGTIWERNIEELMPYAFQVLGLLLDLTPDTMAAGGWWGDLFGRVLEEELWRSPSNVPGINRVLRAYLAKRAIFAGPLQGAMPVLFERFRFALGHRKLGNSAFALLTAIVKYLPPEVYCQYFRTAVALALQRLEAHKAPELEKDLVISLSLFAHLQPDPEALPMVLEQIQPGIFEHFLSHVFLPSAAKVLLLQRRKICVVGLARLMACAKVRSNPQLLLTCCECLAGLLKWRNAGLMCWLSAVLLPRLVGDEPVEVQQYEVGFSRLVHAEASTGAGRPPGPSGHLGATGWDPLPEVQDKASGLLAVRAALEPARPAILALGKVPPQLEEIWR